MSLSSTAFDEALEQTVSMMPTKQPKAAIQRLPRTEERQLVATGAIAAGEQVVCEAPLVSIELKPRFAYGDYCWDLVDLLLRDPTLMKSLRSCALWATPQLLDPHSLLVEAHLVQKHKKSRQLVRNLHALVATNNIGIVTASQIVVGYGLYRTLSHADHSCDPSCRLEPGSPEMNELALYAKRDLRSGEAITWSYFREAEFLAADFDTRNEALVDTFRFACRCSRCQSERPPELSGVRDLLAYYDKRIKVRTRELVQTEEGVRAALASSPLAQHRAALANAQRAGAL